MTTDEHERDAAVGLAELVTLAGVVGVAVLSWVALALAQASVFSTGAAIGATAVVLVAVGVVVARLDRPRLHVGVAGLVLSGVALLVGLFMFLPGAPYAFGDKDPGVYVIHGAAIESHGSVHIDDIVLERVPEVRPFSPGARFPGIWTEGSTDQVTPQFYHLYPSLLAVADGLGDVPLSFHVNPLLGAVGLVALALAMHRVAGPVAAAVVAAFWVTNMLVVWQAKYPTTEILTVLFVFGALLGAALAFRTGWRSAAAAAGVLTGLSFLARPDGLVYVLLGLGAAAVCIVVAPRDHRPRWFVGGLALTMPHALVNAYDLRRIYSLANDLPELRVTTAAVAAIVVSTVVALLLRRRVIDAVEPRLGGRLAPERIVATVAVLGAVVATAMFGFFQFREQLLGTDTFDYNGREIPSFDEINLVRLELFFPLRGLALVVLGVLALGFWQRRGSVWLLGLVLVPTLPLYLWAAKISPRLMWWGRRFVPAALPALLILAAIGAAWLLMRREWWIRVPTAALVLSLVGEMLAMSWPLRDHREFGGSYEFSEDLAAAVGEDAMVLWDGPVPNDIFGYTRTFAAVLWFVHDIEGAFLAGERRQAYVERFADEFADRPIVVVTESDQLPDGLDPEQFTLREQLGATLPLWEEDVTTRPDAATSVSRELRVYEYARG